MLITPNLWNFQRVLHTLAATQEVPRHTVSTREEARESRPHPEEPRFRLLAPEEGSFPYVVGKEFPAFPSHLKRRRSPQERREELQSRATFPDSPRCLSPFQGNLFSLHCLDFKPRINSHHSGTWDSPVGSLVGKPRGIATDPLIHGKGSVNLLLQLGRKLTCMPPLEMTKDSPGETREVAQDPYQQWRGILRFRHRLHTRS